jgi:hypothetical protein
VSSLSDTGPPSLESSFETETDTTEGGGEGEEDIGYWGKVLIYVYIQWHTFNKDPFVNDPRIKLKGLFFVKIIFPTT